MTINWTEVCFAARDKPKQQLADENFGWSGVLVRTFSTIALRLTPPRAPARARAAVGIFQLLIHTPHQISAYCVLCVASAVALSRWKRLDDTDRELIWRLYPHFAGLLLAGSLCGIIGKSFDMKFRDAWFATVGHDVQPEFKYAMLSHAFFFHGMSLIFRAFEFSCLVLAKIMVLSRIMTFVSLQSGHSVLNARRTNSSIALLVFLLLACIVAHLMESNFCFAQLQGFSDLSAVLAAGSNISAADRDVEVYAFHERREAGELSDALEVCVLLGVVSFFAVVTCLCARIFRATRARISLLPGNHERLQTKIQTLKIQILSSSFCVFATFCIRAAYDTINLYLFFAALHYRDPTCNICGGCQPDAIKIRGFMIFTPAIHSAVELVSVPLTLLVALWGMTSGTTMRLFRRRRGASSKKQSLLLRQSEAMRALG